MISNLLIFILISFIMIFTSLKIYPVFLIPSIIISVSSGLFLFFYRKSLKLFNGHKIFFSLLGIISGYLLSTIVLSILNPFIVMIQTPLLPYFKLAFQLFLMYIIAFSFYIKSYELKQIYTSEGTSKRKSKEEGEDSDNYKILDTSVIIDGRIADISETGFLEGILIIPRFVLNELQQIADSADSLKRQRGRRGLDILNKMKKGIKAVVQIVDDDFPEVKEVDEKLIYLGKKLNGTVVTNDFNLNKVAQIQGVQVLNINELANAVKPIVLPGEEMTILISKEGKDSDQGVGYLEDGTMVVVEKGHQYMGKKVDVVVTSVLQTTAGRMIFAK
ncbi:MAG: TRAM domain-containing protein [Spirochaetes bacterium]|nr:TRAM domain-containing protein [Spirochaetota bacterium]